MRTDKQIRQDILAELAWEPATNRAAITVAVYGGVVSLSGHAATYLQRHMAEQAARRVAGVKAIVEHITVQPEGAQAMTDEAIAAAIVQLLEWHTEIPAHQLQIRVEDGHVTVDGYVDGQFQKDAVYDAIKAISGIRGISNFILVMPRADAAVVSQDIERALGRKADLHAHHIVVTALGNRVVLRGKVGTWAQRQIAEYAAWSAPGVSDVADELVIG